MNYLEAKTVLLAERTSPISFTLIAAEAAALLVVAAILVRVFS